MARSSARRASRASIFSWMPLTRCPSWSNRASSCWRIAAAWFAACLGSGAGAPPALAARGRIAPATTAPVTRTREAAPNRPPPMAADASDRADPFATRPVRPALWPACYCHGRLGLVLGIFRSRMRRRLVAVVLVLGASGIVTACLPPKEPPPPPPPPPSFQDTVALQGLVNPTVVAFSPDGRVFVAEKSG